MIRVEEPTQEAALAILTGLRDRYENFHHVKIGDAALCAAVELSVRYLPAKRLPDKALDLIDEAAACMRVDVYKRQAARRPARPAWARPKCAGARAACSR